MDHHENYVNPMYKIKSGGNSYLQNFTIGPRPAYLTILMRVKNDKLLACFIDLQIFCRANHPEYQRPNWLVRGLLLSSMLGCGHPLL